MGKAFDALRVIVQAYSERGELGHLSSSCGVEVKRLQNWIDGKVNLEADERRVINDVVQKNTEKRQQEAWQESHKTR